MLWHWFWLSFYVKEFSIRFWLEGFLILHHILLVQFIIESQRLGSYDTAVCSLFLTLSLNFVGASLHMCMTPHGPDAATFQAASTADLQPRKLGIDALAFMFEFNCIPKVFPWALQASELQKSYYQCWQGLKSHFNGSRTGSKLESNNLGTEALVRKEKSSTMQQGPA